MIWDTVWHMVADRVYNNIVQHKPQSFQQEVVISWTRESLELPLSFQTFYELIINSVT